VGPARVGRALVEELAGVRVALAVRWDRLFFGVAGLGGGGAGVGSWVGGELFALDEGRGAALDGGRRLAPGLIEEPLEHGPVAGPQVVAFGSAQDGAD
jgi:hypothetical protein